MSGTELIGSSKKISFYREENDHFGPTVSLSYDGQRLAVRVENGDPMGNGYVYAFERDGSELLRTVINAEGLIDEPYRISISGNGAVIAIGGSGHEGGNGLVRVFRFGSYIDWMQMVEIEGEAIGGKSGTSVSLSRNGDIVAIGASSGVGIFQWYEFSWHQLGANIVAPKSGTVASVSISDNGRRVAISVGSRYGDVRVFQWTGTKWRRLGSSIVDKVMFTGFGEFMDLSGNGRRVAIGAPRGDGRNSSDSGYVSVFEWDGSSWEQMGENIDGEAPGDQYGSVSISADGQLVAIGAPRADGHDEGSGHVRVFEWSGSIWKQKGLDIDGWNYQDEKYGHDISTSFGYSVTLSGDGRRLAIGSPSAPRAHYDEINQNVGRVGTYEWDGTDWDKKDGILFNREEGFYIAEGAYFGRTVSLSYDGQRLAVGAANKAYNGDDNGHVFVYDWDGLELLGTVIDGEAPDDGSYHISMSGNGDVVAIGGPGHDGGNGHVRVFTSEVREPTIVIRPYKEKNKIKLSKHKEVNVAVLGSYGFYARDVDVGAVQFGPGKATPLLKRRMKDVNLDGYKDMVLWFNVEDSGLSTINKKACLTFQTKVGREYVRCASVRIVK